MAVGEPRPTESQEHVQTHGGAAMGCVKQNKKGGASQDLHESGQKLGQVLNLLGRAQWKDEASVEGDAMRAYVKGEKERIATGRAIQGLGQFFELMGQTHMGREQHWFLEKGNQVMELFSQAQIRKEKSRDFEEGNWI